MFLDYLNKFHTQDCLDILNEKDIQGYFSIKIDFLKLFETHPEVGDKVLCSSVETLPACNKDIIKAQQNILEKEEIKSDLILKYSLKRNVYARFYALPVCPELHRTVFPKNSDLGCFLKVTGTVVRVTQAKMLEYQRQYVCMKCKYENIVEAEFENRYILRAPNKCGSTDTRCKCSTFTQVSLVSREHCKDYQEIKIQEQVNKLSIGTIPGSMWVVLENDLVDSCKPGDDVIICGTVRRRWRPCSQNKKSEIELVLQANYLEVSNAQKSEIVSSAPDVQDCFSEYWAKFEACPLKGRDQILASVCPQVYGLHLVKLAVLLTVITGSNHIVENEETNIKGSQDDKQTTRVRGQCHLLLVGDPGTGKSRLLRTGAELTARSVFTSGAGSTRAGLTCAALRENGEWQLEAGALVLSDGGVCCIDEISHMRDHDRTAIHEAMEQQTISVAKAGIVCKLNTRCSIIAACNPKGHYLTDQPLSVNVSLGTPLLSRFDLIFIMLDSKNKDWDELVSSYILFGDANPMTANKKWSLEKLQMYISLVGPRSTAMTKSANIILQSYYMMQRKSEYRDPSRTTVRMLDSLVRLSQAHCRLMYRTTVLPMDTIIAVALVDLSMQDCTLDDTVDVLHSTFHKYPDYDYLCTAKKLLTRLNLYTIWQEELLYYAKLLQVDHKTLESEIDKSSCHFFAKYDNVSVDNIALSSSVVTSTYFNKKKQNDVINEQDNNKDDKEGNKINDRLAATLKKHAASNKDERKLPSIQNKKNAVKRKRKQVIVDSSAIVKQSSKKNKKIKGNRQLQEMDISESDTDVDINDLLKNVPSVNDFIGIELRNEHRVDLDMHNQEEIKSNSSLKNNCPNISVEIEEKSTSLESKQRNNESTSTINKLKQFQFVEKNDLNKYYDDKLQRTNDNNSSIIESKLNRNNSDVSSVNQKSQANSQISMFESSDCDIELDI